MKDLNVYTIFSEDSENPKNELFYHPYTKYAAEQREKQVSDPYCPRYHFSAPEGRMNDPNGLCFWKGKWHLFYQAYPPEGTISWGHAVSEDLLHWKDLPYAINPDIEQACWSGATLVEENRVIAIYLGNEYGIIVAVSSDPLLLNWNKIGHIPNDVDKYYPVYDPCIWKQDDWYYALSGGKIDVPGSERGVRAGYLFRSRDLVAWEYVHPFIEGGFDCLPGDDGACPYFWPIGDKYLYLHFSHQSGSKYLLGHYDTENQKFIGIRGGSFNTHGIGSSYAGGTHAPSATPDGKGGVVAVFNIADALVTDSRHHYQIVGLPRRFTLIGAKMDELAIEPAVEVSSMREKSIAMHDVALPAGQEVLLNGVQGNVMDLYLELAPADTLPTIDISVLRSQHGEEATHIRCYRQRGCTNWDNFEACGGWEGTSYDTVIELDNTDSSLLPGTICRAPELGSFFLMPTDPLRLRIFIDKSVVEVFVNDRLCLSTRVYPSRSDSLGVSLCAKEKDTVLLHAQAWQYKFTH